MSEAGYYLRWRGQDSGPFTPDQIRQMWDTGQISGAYQVSTDTGMLLVQDFLPQLEEAAASERQRQQQAAQAQAEAEQRRMEHTRLEAERARQQQAEQDRIKQEQKRNGVSFRSKLGKEVPPIFGRTKKRPVQQRIRPSNGECRQSHSRNFSLDRGSGRLGGSFGLPGAFGARFCCRSPLLTLLPYKTKGIQDRPAIQCRCQLGHQTKVTPRIKFSFQSPTQVSGNASAQSL